MGGQNCVGSDMAQRREDCNSSLTKSTVDGGVGKGCQRVSCKWGEEDERYGSVGNVVVRLEL